MRDVNWLGFSFGERALYASDYFEEMYQLAEELIVEGKAYVDHLSDEEIREYRGSLGEPGRPSPYRDADRRRKTWPCSGRCGPGSCPTGAAFSGPRSMSARANMKMRDPLLYRIRHARHHRTGDAWPIYPMYDWAHPLSDGIEGVTHSICTLEFENNRELYDWVIDNTRRLGTPRVQPTAPVRVRPTQPRLHRHEQAEAPGAGRRGLRRRAGTIRGCRRSPPCAAGASALRRSGPLPTWSAWPRSTRRSTSRSSSSASETISTGRRLGSWVSCGPSRSPSPRGRKATVEQLTGALLPARCRQARRADHPLRSGRSSSTGTTSRSTRRPVISGWPRAGRSACATAPASPVMRSSPKSGEVVEVRCHHVPDSVGKNPPGVKVSGVIHWVPATQSVPAEVRLYDRLFLDARPGRRRPATSSIPTPGGGGQGARLEPSLAGAEPGSRWQLERVGYFVFDTVDSRPDAPVLNRIVTLRDSWQAQDAAAGRAGAGAEDGQDQHPSAEEEPHRVPGGGSGAGPAAGRSIRHLARRGTGWRRATWTS